MASYHLSASIIGRSDGRSAVAAAAYRAAARLTCDETGAAHDYRRKRGVVAAEVIAPDGAPAWTTDRAALWNAVHAKETRKNSQLAREVRVALPHELDPAARADLVREWVRAEFVARGMVADVAIHDPDPDDHADPRNAHAHILLTLRGLDPAQPDGWAKGKARDWNTPETLEGWRASWAAAQNDALARAGAAARVDHRSLAAQREAALEDGDDLLALTLDRPPEPRLGVAAGAVETRARRADPDRTRPATDRGRALAEARNGRAALLDAYDRARALARVIGETAQAVRRAVKPRNDWLRQRLGLDHYAADETPPPAAAPPEPPPEPDDGLPAP